MNQREYSRKTQAGLTLTEVLIALLILAVGLSGILATFPVGQRLAAECEETCMSSVIFSNYYSFIFGTSFPQTEVENDVLNLVDDGFFKLRTSSGESDSGYTPMNSVFKSFPFKPQIYKEPSLDGILYDSTTGRTGYQVSISYAKTNKGTSAQDFRLYLMTVQREGSDRAIHMMVGSGFQFTLE